MANLVTVKSYYGYEDLVIESERSGTMILKAGEGAVVKGQVFDFDATSTKLVKHVANADVVAVALDSADSTNGDVAVEVLIEGTVNAFKLVGIDYIVSEDELNTPSKPVLSLVEGGNLTANTELKFLVVAKNANGKTVPSASEVITPLNATKGYVESESSVANIGAINAILGNCSVVNKTLLINVNGVTNSVVFNADYSGAGAFATLAAFIAFCDTASSTTIVTNGSKIKIESDVAGAGTSVTIISDSTGLFGNEVSVIGYDARKTVKVSFEEVVGATGYLVYKSVDGGTNYTVTVASSIDIANLYVLDNGALTYTSAVPMLVSDIDSLKSMYKQGLYVEEIITGYLR